MKPTPLAGAEEMLRPYGFDAHVQARFAERLSEPSENAVRGELAPLPEASLPVLPPLGSAERRRLTAVGLELLARGEAGVVILAGGMATRFGGVVKAVVPVLEERSFLQLKMENIGAVGRAAGRPVPTFVMSSFATHEVLAAHIAERLAEAEIRLFPQSVALRLAADGSLFHDASGALSPYATGHGDLVDALRRSGVLRDFRAAGGRLLFMCNVDNLGATLDPALLALHGELGGGITAEVVQKYAGDAGGAPALLDGVPQIIEGFRFPPDFDQSRIGVFNTNTLTFSAAAIDREFPLPYYRVHKKVDGRPVVQFERLVGELTAFVPSRFVVVPREGPDCRFIAVKEPVDLERERAMIAAIVASNRGLG